MVTVRESARRRCDLVVLMTFVAPPKSAPDFVRYQGNHLSERCPTGLRIANRYRGVRSVRSRLRTVAQCKPARTPLYLFAMRRPGIEAFVQLEAGSALWLNANLRAVCKNFHRNN